jgi:hypothetical protein
MSAMAQTAPLDDEEENTYSKIMFQLALEIFPRASMGDPAVRLNPRVCITLLQMGIICADKTTVAQRYRSIPHFTQI